MQLSEWDKKFSSVKETTTPKAGVLLKVIPAHSEWDNFLLDVKNGWGEWSADLIKFPYCLIVLFGGLAFYEYDENTFWPKLEADLNLNLSQNQRSLLANSFSVALTNLGLKVLKTETRTSYVGTAISLIGVPINLWDDFLKICEWVKWIPSWQAMSNDEWDEAVSRRIGGRQRLRKFLVENREAATAFINEILQIKDTLNKNKTLSVSDIVNTSVLRYEYFEEVPETADFLREENPDSLFPGKAKLIWDDIGRNICLYLPAIKIASLPANWSVEGMSQQAASNPDELVLNSKAFKRTLSLLLNSPSLGKQESQEIKGIAHWGLFDLGKGNRLVNKQRQELPLSRYVLVSEKKIDLLSRNGFENHENVANEPFELSDSTNCFITRLWPTSKFADLALKINDQVTKIRFKTRAKIEARFFVGKGNTAGNFTRMSNNRVKIENLPLLCVLVPHGYFQNTLQTLNSTFKVFLDCHVAPGFWEYQDRPRDGEHGLYFWKWQGPPIMGKIESFSGRLKDLRYRAPDLKGDHTISIQALKNFVINYDIRLEHSFNEMKECWQDDLPGDYLLWFILCQSIRGVKWEDMLLARDIIAPNQPLSYYLLKKYVDLGYIKQNGQYWQIIESRASVNLTRNTFRLDFCGDPSILWGLFRLVCHLKSMLGAQVPDIEVITERGAGSCLQMLWPRAAYDIVVPFLEKRNVKMVPDLWTR